MFTIDKTTYNKAKLIPYDPTRQCGYQPRPIGRLDIRSLIDHTTNGKSGTSLAAEANYIYRSRSISSHYLIGKNGEIIEFLDPIKYIAYHAGCVKSTTFSNLYSIGIEMHNTVNEGPCTALQIEALTWLVKQQIERFSIKKENIETHRAVAVYCAGHPSAGKTGRKIDPSGFPDNQFYNWREGLYTDPTMWEFEVIVNTANVRSSPQVNDTNIVGKLSFGDRFKSVAIKKDELGQVISGKSTWAHLTEGTHNGQSVNGLGFVHMSTLKQIA